MFLAFVLFSSFCAPLIAGDDPTTLTPPTAPTEEASSLWRRLYAKLFPPSAAGPPAAVTTPSAPPVQDAKDTESSSSEEKSDPAEQSLLEQTANLINQSPDGHADSNSIYGLYQSLSKMVEVTGDGNINMKMPTSEMLEQVKPYTDSFVDTSMLITMLKGYESFMKAKNTVGNVVDFVGK